MELCEAQLQQLNIQYLQLRLRELQLQKQDMLARMACDAVPQQNTFQQNALLMHALSSLVCQFACVFFFGLIQVCFFLISGQCHAASSSTNNSFTRVTFNFAASGAETCANIFSRTTTILANAGILAIDAGFNIAVMSATARDTGDVVSDIYVASDINTGVVPDISVASDTGVNSRCQHGAV